MDHPASVNLDKTFFSLARAEKGEKRGKAEKSKAKQFRVKTEKSQIFKLYSVDKALTGFWPILLCLR
jgi:hypothetical protein